MGLTCFGAVVVVGDMMVRRTCISSSNAKSVALSLHDVFSDRLTSRSPSNKCRCSDGI